MPLKVVVFRPVGAMTHWSHLPACLHMSEGALRSQMRVSGAPEQGLRVLVSNLT